MAVIDQYFKYLVEAGGSDLHLSEGQPPKVRVNGTISAISDENLEGQAFKNLLAEICDPQAFQKYLEEGDLDFAYEMDETSRFRCNYFKQQHGLGAVFRLIPTKIATLEELGVPTVVKEFAHMRSGLVLVTGPTGSGKSTTLAAIIDYINSNQARHIITVEEPIEFVHPNKKSIVTQREVPLQTPSFADGLRASLREDSDIVLVGEMRDLETISLALTAAETGLDAVLFFVVQIRDIHSVAPNDATHPAFGEALREAAAHGVRVLAYDCDVTPDSLKIRREVPVIL